MESSQPLSGMVILAIPDTSYKKLAELSARHNVSITELFTKAMDSYIIALEKGVQK
jgi:hypothetical protein